MLGMKYNKLVRDKIPKTIKRKGGKALIHTAKRKEYWEKLKDKLEEEVCEFVTSESIEELADILEVVDAIAKFKKFSKKELKKVKKDKKREKGGFKKGIILEES